MLDIDHSKCKNPIRRFRAFKHYFALQKATTWWNFTEKDGTEKITFFAVSKMRLNEQNALQIVFFKYILNVARIKD